jgi:hypothetical protein
MNNIIQEPDLVVSTSHYYNRHAYMTNEGLNMSADCYTHHFSTMINVTISAGFCYFILSHWQLKKNFHLHLMFLIYIYGLTGKALKRLATEKMLPFLTNDDNMYRRFN